MPGLMSSNSSSTNALSRQLEVRRGPCERTAAVRAAGLVNNRDVQDGLRPQPSDVDVGVGCAHYTALIRCIGLPSVGPYLAPTAPRQVSAALDDLAGAGAAHKPDTSILVGSPASMSRVDERDREGANGWQTDTADGRSVSREHSTRDLTHERPELAPGGQRLPLHMLATLPEELRPYHFSTSPRFGFLKMLLPPMVR